MKPILMDPWDLVLPHAVSRPWQVEDLADEFAVHGWDPTQPALVGYPLDGRIQLLSGTHRCSAARLIPILVPVVVWPRAYVDEAWGDLDLWELMMESGLPRPATVTLTSTRVIP